MWEFITILWFTTKTTNSYLLWCVWEGVVSTKLLGRDTASKLTHGAGIVAQQGKPPPETLASHMGAKGVPVARLLIQLPANVSWINSTKWPKCLGPCTCMEDLEAALGSWLWLSWAKPAAVIWGVSQWMVILSVSPCLSNSAFKKLS